MHGTPQVLSEQPIFANRLVISWRKSSRKLLLNFGQNCEAQFWSRFSSLNLVENLNFDQDWCENWWNKLKTVTLVGLRLYYFNVGSQFSLDLWTWRICLGKELLYIKLLPHSLHSTFDTWLWTSWICLFIFVELINLEHDWHISLSPWTLCLCLSRL